MQPQSYQAIDGLRLGVSSLWDFLMLSQESNQPAIQNTLDLASLDGMYFKLESSLFEKQSKILQTFNQKLKIGSKFLTVTTIRDMS